MAAEGRKQKAGDRVPIKGQVAHLLLVSFASLDRKSDTFSYLF